MERTARCLVVSGILVLLAGCHADRTAQPARESHGPPSAMIVAAAANGTSRSSPGARKNYATASTEFHFSPAEQHALEAFGELAAVALADVDGDGRKDAIVASSSGEPGIGDPGTVVVLRQSPAGVLLPPESTSYLAAETHPDVAAADFDGDGRAEIVVGHSMGITIVRHLPDAALQATLFPSEQCAHMAVLDVGPHGSPDIACQGPATITILRNDGAGSFQVGYSIELGFSGHWRDMKAGDVIGNGLDDLILFHDDKASSFLRVYPQMLRGEIVDDYHQIPLPLDHPGGGGDRDLEVSPWGIATGDFNNDQRTDVAVSSNLVSPGEFEILLQGSNGTLQAPIAIASGAFAGEIASADFDGDRYDDLFVRHPGWSWNGYYRQYAGQLAAESLVDNPALGGLPSNGIAAGDINSDGCKDVAIVETHNLWLYKGAGCKRPPPMSGPGQKFPYSGP